MTKNGELDMSRCKRCDKAIVWLHTRKGMMMPVDAETTKPADYFYDPQKGHVNHWSTCPHAAEFKKKKGTNADKDTSGSGSAPEETRSQGPDKAAEVPTGRSEGRAVLIAGTPTSGKTREAAALYDKARAGIFVDPRSSEAGG